MQLRELTIGSTFGYAGRRWILLDRKEDRCLVLMSATLGSRQYDGGHHARFDQSSLGAWLNKEFAEALLSGGASESDLTPILLNIAPGQTADCVHGRRAGLLSWRQWLRYADLILAATGPKPYWAWQWTCTISEGIHGQGLRCVADRPQSYAYYPPNHPEPEVRPALSLMAYAEVEP